MKWQSKTPILIPSIIDTFKHLFWEHWSNVRNQILLMYINILCEESKQTLKQEFYLRAKQSVPLLKSICAIDTSQ